MTEEPKRDFAEQMRPSVDDHYPDAEVVHVMLNNLNTHSPEALYEVVAPAEARRIVRKLQLQFEHTPNHGSWLNQAETEWSVVSAQCLDRRIPDRAMLEREMVAWHCERTTTTVSVNWRFTSTDTPTKLTRLYTPQHHSGEALEGNATLMYTLPPGLLHYFLPAPGAFD